MMMGFKIKSFIKKIGFKKNSQTQFQMGQMERRVRDWVSQNTQYINSPEVIDKAPDEFLEGAFRDIFIKVINEARANPEMFSTQDDVRDVSKEEMFQWLQSNNENAMPPEEFIMGNNVVKWNDVVQEFAKIRENQTEPAVVDGISSKDLTEVFALSYPDLIQKLYNDFIDDPVYLIEKYAFTEVEGGKKGNRKDMRINFFFKYPQYIPQNLGNQISIEMDNSDLFRFLYKNIDLLTSKLVELMQEENIDLANYVENRISNVTSMGSGGKKDEFRRKNRQFAADDEGKEFDIKDEKEQADYIPSDVQAEQEAKREAMKNELEGMMESVRNLAEDVSDYLKSKNNQKPSTQKRALLIDTIIEIATKQVEAALDPNNPNSKRNASKAGLSVKTEHGRLIATPDGGESAWDRINWPKITSMAPVASAINNLDRRRIQEGQSPLFGLYPVGELTEDMKEKIVSFVRSNSRISEKFPELLKPNPEPNAFRQQLAEAQKYLITKYEKDIYVAPHMILDEIGEYLVREVSSKYPKNVILAFLGLIRIHQKVRSGDMSSKFRKSTNYYNTIRGNADTLARYYMKLNLIKSAINKIHLLKTSNDILKMNKFSSNYSLDEEIEKIKNDTILIFKGI